MRTTVDLDDDAAAEVERLRREGRGLSEAVNELIRRGMVAPSEPPTPFVPRTRRMGLTVDVTDVADALDLLEGPRAR